MSAMVINRIKLTVPAAELTPLIETEFPPVFRSLPGFERFTVVVAAPDEIVVLIRWATAADAANGAAVIGPGLFNTYIAPVAVSQDRVVGQAVVDVE